MPQSPSSHKFFKFFLGGGTAAIINCTFIFLFVQIGDFNTPLLRNFANAIAIEISVLSSFLIYRFWIWPDSHWSLKNLVLKQIPLYHISIFTVLTCRLFILFPILDWLGVNYLINTVIGIIFSAFFNYLIGDRWIFANVVPGISPHTPVALTPEIYYPEGLRPGLSNTPLHDTAIAAPQTQPIAQFSIVIPAYNEEGCIVPTVQAIYETLASHDIPHEILVVNDNSRDRTEELLQNLSQQYATVRYVNNYYPNGFGFAVRCGLENFAGDAVAIVMADNSDSPQNMVDYYHQLQAGYDCVFGSRFIRGGKVVDYPSHKLVVNRLANSFIRILFGFELNDTTNAFKAYRRGVIEGIHPLISQHFNLTVEIPLKAIIRGYSYKIVPITWQNRTTGISKLKLKEMGSRYLLIVLSAWLERHLSQGDYMNRAESKSASKNSSKNS